MASESSEPKHVCSSCANWKEFGSECWFHWEEKKECSQHRSSFMEEPKLKSIKEQIYAALL